MKLNQMFRERPSALPAPAASRVHSLAPGFDPASALTVAPPAAGLRAGDAVGAAPHGAELLADIPAAAMGCSVPTATPAPAAQQMQIPTLTKPTKTVTTKQIDVVPTYRVDGVGGAPPRGRPN